MSGRSISPASSASTLASTPTSPLLKAVDRNGNGTSSASVTVESAASESSSTIFVYDLAEQVGFGGLSKSWSQSRASAAPVVTLQTRDGAGLSLAGRLSQGTSKDAEKGAIVTAYTTPAGVASMAHSLTYLPKPTSSSRLVLQVPNVSPLSDSLALSPSLASLSTALPVLPADFAVVLSSSPQETVALAALAYRVSDYHVLHVFDHYSSARETG
jgi:sulfite reductase (NADPH) flavoprotein alpha-component